MLYISYVLHLINVCVNLFAYQLTRRVITQRLCANGVDEKTTITMRETMNNFTFTAIEMVYGIYYARYLNGWIVPCETREAGCVISDDQTDESIIKQMIAVDFLNEWGSYIVEDNKCSMHIFHKIKGHKGALALVLIYEHDLEVQ